MIIKLAYTKQFQPKVSVLFDCTCSSLVFLINQCVGDFIPQTPTHLINKSQINVTHVNATLPGNTVLVDAFLLLCVQSVTSRFV